MESAKAGDTVRIHYTGTLEDGTQFDTSAGRDPLEFSLGEGEVIAGFEEAVDGMAVGESKTIKIEPEQAYGPRREQLVQDVPRKQLPNDLQPAVGMQLRAQREDGEPMQFVVTEVTEEAITVDGNHPLAGQPLKFEIELVAIV